MTDLLTYQPILVDVLLGIGGVLLTIAGAGVGYYISTVKEMVRDLQKNHDKIATQLNEVKLIVAGDYVKRSELREMREDIMTELHAIHAKINEKADKP